MGHFRSNILVLSLFRFVCMILTVSFVTYNIILYSEDEDLTEVSFKMYNQDEESIYPGITICIDKPFEFNKLEKFGMGSNKTTYKHFLQGRLWDDRLLKINFDSVVMDIKDYLIEACIKTKFNGKCLNFDPQISTFFEPSKRQCYAFGNAPGSNIVYVETKMNVSLFPNQIRPEMWKFIVRFPFPSQIFRSSKMSYGEWQNRQNLSNGFTMNFQVRNVQVIRRRNKKSKSCYAWNNYDNLIMHEISKQLGCRPLYWGKKSTLPICNTKRKMGMFEKYFFDRYFGSDDSASYIPPCLELEDIQIEYSDIESETRKNVEKDEPIFDEEDEVVSHDTHPETMDWFKVRLWFRSNRFIEIKQVKAYNFQNLVGNGGGYMGLFLGYSIVQLPSMIMSDYRRLKKIILSKVYF